MGHGAFTLYHTFSSKDKSIPQGSTYNLMDYPPVGGQATTKQPDNLLRKYQWHTIHNPRISLFGGEEEEVSEEIVFKYKGNIILTFDDKIFRRVYKDKLNVNWDAIIYSNLSDAMSKLKIYSKKHEINHLFIDSHGGSGQLAFNFYNPQNRFVSAQDVINYKNEIGDVNIDLTIDLLRDMSKLVNKSIIFGGYNGAKGENNVVKEMSKFPELKHKYIFGSSTYVKLSSTPGDNKGPIDISLWSSPL